jgi:hypothetical protein
MKEQGHAPIVRNEEGHYKSGSSLLGLSPSQAIRFLLFLEPHINLYN